MKYTAENDSVCAMKSLKTDRTSNVKISIVILTCNRNQVLTELLQDLHRQTFADFETIVVDNNSSDNTPQILVDKFPFVKLISLKENTGCGGRNAGIKAAKGEIIVTLDDDILLKGDDALQRLLKIFEENRGDVINFLVLDYYTQKLAAFNWYHPKKMEDFCDKEFETDYISEGAVAFKKTVFDNVGYYYADYFLGHEGVDLAYRILDNDFKIIYSPEVVVLHKHVKAQRTSWRGTYYDTRNYVWLFLRHYPVTMLIPSLTYRLFTTFIHSVSRRQVYWYLKAVRDAVAKAPAKWKERKPLKQATIDKLSKLRAERPSAVSKMRYFVKRMRERDY